MRRPKVISGPYKACDRPLWMLGRYQKPWQKLRCRHKVMINTILRQSTLSSCYFRNDLRVCYHNTCSFALLSWSHVHIKDFIGETLCQYLLSHQSSFILWSFLLTALLLAIHVIEATYNQDLLNKVFCPFFLHIVLPNIDVTGKDFLFQNRDSLE